MATLDEIYTEWRSQLLQPVDRIDFDRVAALEASAHARGVDLITILSSGAIMAAAWDGDMHPRGKDGRFIELMGWVNVDRGSGFEDSRGQVTDISPDPDNPGKPKITVDFKDRDGKTIKTEVLTPDKLSAAAPQKARLNSPEPDDGMVDPPDWARDMYANDPNDPNLLDAYMENELGYDPKTMYNLDERHWDDADARMQDEMATWRVPDLPDEEDDAPAADVPEAGGSDLSGPAKTLRDIGVEYDDQDVQDIADRAEAGTLTGADLDELDSMAEDDSPLGEAARTILEANGASGNRSTEALVKNAGDEDLAYWADVEQKNNPEIAKAAQDELDRRKAEDDAAAAPKADPLGGAENRSDEDLVRLATKNDDPAVRKAAADEIERRRTAPAPEADAPTADSDALTPEQEAIVEQHLERFRQASGHNPSPAAREMIIEKVKNGSLKAIT